MTLAVPHSTDARVVLYGREHCHLCDLAREVVRAVCDDTGTDWVEVDVDTDPRLVAAFTEQVPVCFVDGRQHAHWKVDEAGLHAALAESGGRDLPTSW